MLPTPSTSHLSFTNIYEPAEDSYLLLDALSSPAQTTYLSTRFPSTLTAVPLVLEIGPGSGVVLAFVAAHARPLFGRRDVLALGIDANVFACAAAASTVRRALRDADPAAAGALVDVLRGDLGGCVRRGQVDVCVFNPPYVPSEVVPPLEAAEERGVFARDSALLALATDGGADGMAVTERLLEQLDALLSSRGVAYVLLCARNSPELVARRIRGWGHGWTVDTVHSSGKQGGCEKLQIIRIARRIDGL